MWQDILGMYNRNRFKIWSVIIIIAIILLVIQFFNYLAKEEQESYINNGNTSNNTSTNEPNYGIITPNEEIEQSGTSVDKLTVIDMFFNSINENNVEEAYKILSEESKEVMYPTIQDFNEKYFEKIYSKNGVKVNVLEWTSTVYRVEIYEDPLITGNYVKDNAIYEYVSINNENKININGFIGRVNSSAKIETETLNIEVKEIDTYMDYVEYTFNIKNNTSNIVLLDSLELTDTMYIVDNNQVKYNANQAVLSQAELMIDPNINKEIKIQYFSKYQESKSIKSIVFEKIILEHEIYERLENKNLYNNYEYIRF